jgi:predicted GH43/DUF377 family glycosyl hydrolase
LPNILLNILKDIFWYSEGSKTKEVKMIILQRLKENPVLGPDRRKWWEKEARFNPGVCQKDGYFLLLYRAIGEPNYISRLGLAVSEDGKRFEPINDHPVFFPQKTYEQWGCEDPRIILMENGEFFITYVALSRPAREGGGPPATALLATRDFKKFKRYGIITPLGSDNRDVVIFPEKINGEYVMLHRPHRWTQQWILKPDPNKPKIWLPPDPRYLPYKPSIWIAYSYDLYYWRDYKIVMEPVFEWEKVKIGAGVPPIKTEAGWLLIYHGVDEKNKKKVYRVGAALLKLEDPSEVIARLPYPILEPQMKYEREGYVPNVVFPTGAVVKDGILLVYYGGADKVIGVAFCEFDLLLKELKKHPFKKYKK